MNHSYRLVWNDSTHRYVPAPEIARGRGKSRTAKALAPAALLLGALLISHAQAQVLPAAALPTGAKVVSGSATIGLAGSEMTIKQESPKAILHWQGFDIGSGSKVHFIQPDPSAIALNRVLAGGPSRIEGQLKADGQLWLVNPNGIMFGRGSRVDVGGLVASTLDITNGDFHAGKRVFTRGAAQGGITNQGYIRVADGGTLALLAPSVQNEDPGTLTANFGNVVLAGGDRITLQAGVDGRLEVAVDGATVDTLIENRWMIVADGGQVMMTAKAADALSGSVVANRGYVQAHALVEKEGRILLQGDMQHGKVVLDGGALIATASDGGGFVETSAAKVQIGAGAYVATGDAGEAGNWLIRGRELSIGPVNADPATSGINAKVLNDSLASTSIRLQAVGSATEKGNIHVNAPISWDRHTLALDAHGSINVNAVMTAAGTAALEMDYGGHSTMQPAAGSGVYMALRDNGFAGRVDFIGRNEAGASTNQLKINGDSYNILTAGSMTQQDLQGIGGGLSGKYALGADIDARGTVDWNNGAGFAPIGAADDPFTGTFEGLGHTITGLTVNRPTQDYAGLFGNALNATLRNVGLEGGSVTGNNHVGGLAGFTQAGGSGAMAVISNVYTTATVSGVNNVGGLVGTNSARGGEASIFGSRASGAVWGEYLVGGLAGLNLARDRGLASISESHASASQVVGAINFVGGLMGVNQVESGGTARIFNSSYTGGVVFGGYSSNGAIVAGTGNYVGGLVGYNLVEGGGTATVSGGRVSEATVVGSGHDVGGLVGRNEASDGGLASISGSRAQATVQGQELIGGLVGWSGVSGRGTASIRDSHAEGKIKGVDLVGGLVGANEASGGNAEISYGSATGNVEGGNFLGGLVGQNIAEDGGVASIGYSKASGQVSGISRIGGLVGSNKVESRGTASIFDSHATGAQVVGAINFVGGLVGANEVDSGGTASISSSSYTGGIVFGGYSKNGVIVEGTGNYVGGVAGANIVYSGGFASITRAEAFAEVSGITSVGGLVGINAAIGDGEALISKAYAIGSVSGTNHVGGLVGANQAQGGNAGISDVYAGGAVKGSSHVGGLVGSNQVDGGMARIRHSYATGAVSGSSNLGGLVGFDNASIESSFYATTDAEGSPINSAAGFNGFGQGKTFAELTQLSTFAGWDIDDQGGTGHTWRIYDGSTTPLLRSFLQPVTVTANRSEVAAKTYDGKIASGPVGFTSDIPDAALSGQLGYASSSKNAGWYAAADGTLEFGGLYSNQQGYDITYAEEMNGLSLTIGKAQLHIAGTQVMDKTYDGNTAASVTAGQLHNLVAGDESLGVSASGAFASRNAGTHAVAVTYTLANGSEGVLAANYELRDTHAYAASIERAALTIEAVPDRKTYDGSTASVGSVQVAGLVGGDRVTGLGQSFDSRHAGTRSLRVDTGYVIDDGNGGNNYRVTTAAATGVIDPRALTITARDASKLDGEPVAFDGTEFFTDAGLVQGEAVRSVALASDGSATDADAGRYAIVASNARGDGGFEAGNYTIRYVEGELEVTPASSGDITGALVCGSQWAQRSRIPCPLQGSVNAASNVPAPQVPFLTEASGAIPMN